MSEKNIQLKLIKNGTLISASDTVQADLLIQGEKISLIGQVLDIPDAQVFDAQGKLVMPGGIDPHTHFDLPMFGTISSDDHYTGHKAAAFGGVTTVLDFVSLDYPTLEQSLQAWHAKADEKAAIDFGFHMNLTRLNNDLLKEFTRLPEWGVNTIKVFTAYNNRLRLSDGEITRALQSAKASGLLTLVHAENGDVIELLTAQALENGHTSPEWHAHARPAWSAVEATLRAASLAAITQASMYIVHMNAGGEVDQLEYARQRGAPVMGETCTQYLFFGVEHLQRPDGAKWICSPPMRSQADQERLWQGLSSGSIQVVATDHCPFFFDGRQEIIYEGKPVAIPGKELGKDDFTKIPNGLPGVGDRLPVLWTYGVGHGRINANQFVALTSTNPAKIFGMYPQKGALMPGSDADIAIWDPQRTLTYGVMHAHHRTDYNLYEGWKLTGFPEKVFLRGQLIVDGSHWLGKPGMGRFISRRNHPVVL